MEYRLDQVEKLCSENGLGCVRVEANQVDVFLGKDFVLSFSNLPKENDTLLAFKTTPWHAHGVVQFMTGDGTYVECDELDVLIGLITGELVVVSDFANGELRDRWIAHKNEKMDVCYLEPGVELVVSRLP